jgi:TrmH family RNA methyltransferase
MIDSPSNPTVKELKSLNLAKRRKESRLFLVEGVRGVEDGIRAGHWPQVCLYHAESVERTARGRDLLRILLGTRVTDAHRSALQEASERAIQAVSNTEHPQGIVAAFSQPVWALPDAPEEDSLVLVCDDIQDPGNLGTMLRTAEAAGVSAVLLSPGCADIYNPKVVRAGMGVHFRLPTFPDEEWPIIGASLAKLDIPSTRIFATDAGASSAYDAVDWIVPSALIVSNEAQGLSDEARRAAGGGLLTIPMAGGTESLNAAIASAAILFEAARQRRTGKG